MNAMWEIYWMRTSEKWLGWEIVHVLHIKWNSIELITLMFVELSNREAFDAHAHLQVRYFHIDFETPVATKRLNRFDDRLSWLRTKIDSIDQRFWFHRSWPMLSCNPPHPYVIFSSVKTSAYLQHIQSRQKKETILTILENRCDVQ